MSVCSFVRSESLAQSLSQVLSGDRYSLQITRSEAEFFDWVEQHKQHIDCLILEDDSALLPVINHLYEQGILLPIVILPDEAEKIPQSAFINNRHNESQTSASLASPDGYCYPLKTGNYLFHAAEVRLKLVQLAEIGKFIDQAIARFLSLSPLCSLPDPSVCTDPQTELTNRSFLMQQQSRLSEKLKERLGYLGVYYKRNPKFFLRYLSQKEKERFLDQLKSDYRQIILTYFSQEQSINQEIDSFVNQAFFADISVSRVVEIHMELMEEFSKQLKLEGRSEEVLLDYRLTLIDVIAHLGEMYRRSIPREL
ncbi:MULTISPECIES: circadian clock protein KaiA [unclassified Coleofasciculus]|uniref:circadian clock protein KaiA n=1 Tax=unclassified Coleofasciculus TaxID=2692782 RepID=UPI001D15C0C8|nr:circadian clock protein KaiA [Coleofasciculus sp. LEGE 07092]